MNRLGWVIVFVCALAWSGILRAGDAACIDVEKATVKELGALKGIGPELAKRIVEHRKAERTKATKAKKSKWNFKNWATLMKVKGVSHKVCEDNIGKVCFSGKVQKACPKKATKKK